MVASLTSSRLTPMFFTRYGHDDDPLTRALAPPPGETPAQRADREALELASQRRSDEIDDELRREKETERKKKPVKLLLLGQSESGKTATLKNFQLKFAGNEWRAERDLWRFVIVFNLIRNVTDILDEMAAYAARPALLDGSSSESDDASTLDSFFTTRRSGSPIRFKDRHRLLRTRLSPLRQIQKELEGALGNAAIEVNGDSQPSHKPNEFSIIASHGWKSAFDKLKTLRTQPVTESQPSMGRLKGLEEDILEALEDYLEDIVSLWNDPVVREMLARRRTHIEDTPGFFLDDVRRIARRAYVPTDDDILRSRLRTLGVQEHRFVFQEGLTKGREWRLYDVGGAHSSRAAWYPYFDDVDAIIFLAPISCFDEKLSEDRRVNRLEDSYYLWKTICECELLKYTQIILFLNKCDILEAKLERGVRVQDYVSSYGDRANNVATASKYFQHHFKELMKNNSPSPRTFYSHFTSVVQKDETAKTLAVVEESILRDHLRRADLM
ncbi:G-alpha-domain-containing protein [Cylindrobasidium torrendii FP15055 ss-10]|uniref:G-alpha-domain-containing protein n=1 Tax=Cylindrobasidium torrendii FP15055 ss-10 TaxID=1314674 RepID=A0A0D7BBT7_9AGAR|nr:G-alpha-domain-containing protein [Cylindrobasidium torrendii FP15055 ss-10]